MLTVSTCGGQGCPRRTRATHCVHLRRSRLPRRTRLVRQYCVWCWGMDTPRLAHVRVNVRDLAASIDWYQRLLGVPASGHWPPEAPTYVHFNIGGVQLALGQY